MEESGREIMLRRSPLFTLTVVLTLALGIGANTAIFTVVNSVLLRPLPFQDPARLVAIWDTYQPNFPKLGVSPTEYDEWKRQTDIFEEVGRYRSVVSGQEANLTGGAEPRRVQASCASSSLFRMLGVHALLGVLSMPRMTGSTHHALRCSAIGYGAITSMPIPSLSAHQFSCKAGLSR
jgi:MacB-like periplasmic core domain